MRHVHASGSVILKIKMVMLKMALPDPTTLAAASTSNAIANAAKDAAVAGDGSVLLHCGASEHAVATAQQTLIKKRCLGYRCRRGVTDSPTVCKETRCFPHEFIRF